MAGTGADRHYVKRHLGQGSDHRRNATGLLRFVIRISSPLHSGNSYFPRRALTFFMIDLQNYVYKNATIKPVASATGLQALHLKGARRVLTLGSPQSGCHVSELQECSRQSGPVATTWVPHHLRHLQPRALGRKASDEFAVPLCRIKDRKLALSMD
jgi:hypothetical protein